MTRERCPECGKLGLPPIKTCGRDNCDNKFRVGEGGRASAIYCSRACARAQYQRNRRRRVKVRETSP